MNIPEDASGVSIKAFEFNRDATKFRIWETNIYLRKMVITTNWHFRRLSQKVITKIQIGLLAHTAVN